MSRSYPSDVEVTEAPQARHRPAPVAQPAPESFELLSVRVHDQPTLTRVTPVGELDLSTAAAFDRCLWESQARAAHVVVDLRALAFADLAGLRSLFAARVRAAEAHRRLELVCCAGQVRRMLSFSGLDQLIEIIEPPPPPRACDAEAVA